MTGSGRKPELVFAASGNVCIHCFIFHFAPRPRIA
jgi:hypothetical protein